MYHLFGKNRASIVPKSLLPIDRGQRAVRFFGRLGLTWLLDESETNQAFLSLAFKRQFRLGRARAGFGNTSVSSPHLQHFNRNRRTYINLLRLTTFCHVVLARECKGHEAYNRDFTSFAINDFKPSTTNTTTTVEIYIIGGQQLTIQFTSESVPSTYYYEFDTYANQYWSTYHSARYLLPQITSTGKQAKVTFEISKGKCRFFLPMQQCN